MKIHIPIDSCCGVATLVKIARSMLNCCLPLPMKPDVCGILSNYAVCVCARILGLAHCPQRYSINNLCVCTHFTLWTMAENSISNSSWTLLPSDSLLATICATPKIHFLEHAVKHSHFGINRFVCGRKHSMLFAVRHLWNYIFENNLVYACVLRSVRWETQDKECQANNFPMNSNRDHICRNQTITMIIVAFHVGPCWPMMLQDYSQIGNINKLINDGKWFVENIKKKFPRPAGYEISQVAFYIRIICAQGNFHNKMRYVRLDVLRLVCIRLYY